MPTSLDSTDRRILSILQTDSSLTNVELARRVHLSPSPCLARVKAREAACVIRGYVALADPLQLRLRLKVFIQVCMATRIANQLQHLRNAMPHSTEARQALLCAGGSRYLVGGD